MVVCLLSSQFPIPCFFYRGLPICFICKLSRASVVGRPS
jgi:hypothetical protein